MSGVRARLLVPLVLLAVLVTAACGFGTSQASPGHAHDAVTRGDISRPGTTPMSGEPDGGGHNIVATPTTKPSVWFTPGPWLAYTWYQWWVETRHTHSKEPGRR